MFSPMTLIGCVFMFVVCGFLAKEAIKWYTKVDEKLAAQKEIAKHFVDWYHNVNEQLAAQRRKAVKDLISGVHNLAAPPALPGTPTPPPASK